MDNIVDHKMIKEYLEGKIGNPETKIEYGKHLDVIRYINEQEYIMNVGTFSLDYVNDLLDN